MRNRFDVNDGATCAMDVPVDTSRRPGLNRWLKMLGLALGLLVLVLENQGQAQRPLDLTDIPDLRFYAAVDEGGISDWRWLGLEVEAGLGGRIHMGPGLDTTGGLDGYTRLMLNIEPSHQGFFRMDSALTLPVQIDADAEEMDVDEKDLIGRHRVWGQAVLGELGEGASGLDLTFDYRLGHTGEVHIFAHPELGPGPLTDHSLEAGAWLRRGINSRGAFVLPLRYRWRQVSYSDAPIGLLDSTTHEISTGLGLRDYTECQRDGWLELVGVSWSHTGFGDGLGDFDGSMESVEGPETDSGRTADPSSGPVNRLDLRLGHADHLVGGPESGLLIGVNASIGADWLWNDTTGQSASVFAIEYGGAVRYTDGNHQGLFGLSFSRRGGWTPNGEQLIANNRLELSGLYTSREWGVGLSHASRFNWIAHPEVEMADSPALPDPVPDYALHTEWFIEVIGLEVGAYHRADYTFAGDSPGWNPRDRDRNWSHELGLFVRLSDVFSRMDNPADIITLKD